MRDPRAARPTRLNRGCAVAPEAVIGTPRSRLADYAVLFRTPSYILDCAGMTAMTFAIGGIWFWMPRYIHEYRGGRTWGM